MAQIGVVCLGLHLLHEIEKGMVPLEIFINSEVSYKAPVLPGETVKVVSKKLLYRFGVLKCEVLMCNSQGNEVCSGVITGMVKLYTQEEFDQLFQQVLVKV